MLEAGQWLVLPDLQIPYHNKSFLCRLTEWVLNETSFRGTLCVGDEADAPEISRWEKGRAGEYAGTLEQGLIQTQAVMRDFAALGPLHVMRSNHTSTRLTNYLGKYAPAMAGFGSLQYDRLMGYNEHRSTLNGAVVKGATWHPEMWSFARGWVLAHGDEGSLSRIAGSTALNLAKRIGASVLCGHTHRMGAQHHTTGFNGRVVNALSGVEVGHLMSTRDVSYLNTGMGDWQAGFGILHITESGNVSVETVPVDSKGRCRYYG